MQAEESAVFEATVNAFKVYSASSLETLKAKMRQLTGKNGVQVKAKALKRYHEHAKCIGSNQAFFDAMLSQYSHSQEGGKAEREATYGPILAALSTQYTQADKHDIKVLVPGAGLGRLMYEIVSRGFTCQGNEFSFFMLMASSFALNELTAPNAFTVYPWIHSYSNTRSREDQLRPVNIPDVSVVSTLNLGKADFSMVAGDFLEVYGNQTGSWDCVVTCFFIDTAHDVADYIAVIASILKPKGLWINLGPLLYHFEGMSNEPSIEYTLEEVYSMISESFDIQSKSVIPTVYASNVKSMLSYQYQAEFFIATLK